MLRHAALALHEWWSISIFGAWGTVARAYVADHYRPNACLTLRGAEERRIALEAALADAVRVLVEGDVQ